MRAALPASPAGSWPHHLNDVRSLFYLSLKSEPSALGADTPRSAERLSAPKLPKA